MMDERRKSDNPVLPMKSSNEAGSPVAERMEGRGSLSRSDALSALERIRQAAKKDREMRFTALFHQNLRAGNTAPGLSQFAERSCAWFGW
jgi:RNA-directed DNA polymerase